LDDVLAKMRVSAENIRQALDEFRQDLPADDDDTGIVLIDDVVDEGVYILWEIRTGRVCE